MSKRILPVVLVLCIIMAMAPAAFATGEVEPAWDGVTREDIPLLTDGMRFQQALSLQGCLIM